MVQTSRVVLVEIKLNVYQTAVARIMLKRVKPKSRRIRGPDIDPDSMPSGGLFPSSQMCGTHEGVEGTHVHDCMLLGVEIVW